MTNFFKDDEILQYKTQRMVCRALKNSQQWPCQFPLPSDLSHSYHSRNRDDFFRNIFKCQHLSVSVKSLLHFYDFSCIWLRFLYMSTLFPKHVIFNYLCRTPKPMCAKDNSKNNCYILFIHLKKVNLKTKSTYSK